MRRGLTLISVLIALAVLVVGVAALFRVYPAITRLSERSRSFTAAVLIADRVRAVIEEVYGGADDPLPPQMIEGADAEFPGYVWQARFDEEKEGLYRVELTVSWLRAGTRVSEEFQDVLRRKE